MNMRRKVLKSRLKQFKCSQYRHWHNPWCTQQGLLRKKIKKQAYNFSTKDDKFVFWCPCHLTYYKCTFIYFHLDLTFLMQPVNRSDAETGLQNINPFTAPACKISGLANSTFSGPITSIFNAMHFDENPFTCQGQKKGDKKA